MVRRFGRVGRPALAGILALALLCSRAPAQDGRGIYVGVFGGGGCATIGSVTQLGNALFAPRDGGPLAVHATGGSGTHGFGVAGLHIGHEWSGNAEPGGWGLLPACERHFGW